ncbi:MAG: Antibiotic biosynthesis monooxygenase [Bryobacterales bacterium]|nr:Antibiotic biosynthesis monooxygenase [Bryobacterales bacterium]
MNANKWLKIGGWALGACVLCGCGLSPAKKAVPLVRIAELDIDPEQLEAYKAALSKEIESSIRLEPGVVTLYAVSLRETPTQIRIFETYADRAAYESHIRTPHFLKYKTSTQTMVKSLKLVETDPIYPGAKLK